MRAPSLPFTKADWDRLPEGFPAQLVEGWLLKEPAPVYGHQSLVSRVLRALQSVVGPDRALPAPLDVLVDDLNVYQPDVVVLRKPVPYATRKIRAPLLVVEVLSPATAVRDREVKCTRLLASGTGEVWLVDPATKTIETRDARDSQVGSGDARISSRVLPGFALVASELFGPSR